jgi:hypothetical protein
MSIRQDAVFELPHILLLIDDEHNTLLPAVGAISKNLRRILSRLLRVLKSLPPVRTTVMLSVMQ